MIVQSQNLKGVFTHVIDKKYVDYALSGKFIIRSKSNSMFNKPAGLGLVGIMVGKIGVLLSIIKRYQN
jgi:hypothetical protein